MLFSYATWNEQQASGVSQPDWMKEQEHLYTEGTIATANKLLQNKQQ